MQSAIISWISRKLNVELQRNTSFTPYQSSFQFINRKNSIRKYNYTNQSLLKKKLVANLLLIKVVVILMAFQNSEEESV